MICSCVDLRLWEPAALVGASWCSLISLVILGGGGAFAQDQWNVLHFDCYRYTLLSLCCALTNLSYCLVDYLIPWVETKGFLPSSISLPKGSAILLFVHFRELFSF